jgi:hypothetical protein
MSERRARGAETAAAGEDVQAQVDAVAEQLYGLPPDEFSSARDEYVRQAREQRNQALARELGKLRKPTQSAWLINLLWRNQREVMQQLFELANELSQAQSEAAGPALRELTAQRRQIENALLRQAVTLAEQAGVRVSDSVSREAQETLSAALAIPEVADEVRSGRLVKPASYAGFGAAPAAGGAARAASPARAPIDLAAAQRARSAQGDRRAAEDARRAAAEGEGPPQSAEDARGAGGESGLQSAEDAARQRAEEEAAERAREEEERRRAAQRRLDEARAAVAMAEADVSRTSRAVAEAEQREADRRQQLDTLREQLRRVETEVSAAANAADEARKARAQAEAKQSSAEQAVADAERAVRG